MEITEDQVKEFLQKQYQKELEEDKDLVAEINALVASKGRQIIAVIQTHQNGLIANAVWGVQKI